MLLETRDAPPFYKNGYVLACDDTREAVIIDPGDEVDDLLQVVSDGKLDVRHILLTHGHVDHVSGVAQGEGRHGRIRSSFTAPISSSTTARSSRPRSSASTSRRRHPSIASTT